MREFCQQVGLDASNWSKVERGINPPPGDIGLLEMLADFFDLPDSDKLAFIDEAAIQRNELPPDIANDQILQKTLPAFFRAARSHIEQEANEFAGRLLVPEKRLRNFFDTFATSINQVLPGFMMDAALRDKFAKQIAPRFVVNAQVIAIRLDRDGIWPAC